MDSSAPDGNWGTLAATHGGKGTTRTPLGETVYSTVACSAVLGERE